jgi:hypothetical protein
MPWKGLSSGQVSRLLTASHYPYHDDPARRKGHDAYRQALERLPRDLKVAASPATDG